MRGQQMQFDVLFTKRANERVPRIQKGPRCLSSKRLAIDNHDQQLRRKVFWQKIQRLVPLEIAIDHLETDSSEFGNLRSVLLFGCRLMVQNRINLTAPPPALLMFVSRSP